MSLFTVQEPLFWTAVVMPKCCPKAIYWATRRIMVLLYTKTKTPSKAGGFPLGVKYGAMIYAVRFLRRTLRPKGISNSAPAMQVVGSGTGALASTLMSSNAGV